MDNALYVALSRQMMLRREMDIVANNIANADTAGFKLETLMTRSEQRQPQKGALAGAKPINFVVADGVARNFAQGPLRRTDGPLDLALDGEGFFKVMAPDGERYTRDGRMRTDETGRLTTQLGMPLADDGGGEIVIDPLRGPVQISADGVVSQAGERVGKIGVYRFDDRTGLEKVGDNLFANNSNAAASTSDEARIRQGMVEGSNVQPIMEVTRMIEVSRAYEQTNKVMDNNNDLSRRAIERLARVQ